MQKDVIIIGAGPAGIFTALEMLKRGSKQKILIVEKGRAVEDRRCPKSKTGQCVNCKPYCHITTGFSGAGAFSDGKLSLSYEVGGDLPTLIGAEKAQETINYADKIYLEFGADNHVEGLGNTEEVKAIRKRAIRAGLKLVDCPIRHLGTEKAQELYYAIEQYLLQNGVEILFGYECTNLVLEGAVCRGVRITNGREELEIQFLVSEGIQRLEDGSAFDLQTELEQRLAAAGQKIKFHNGFMSLGLAMEVIAACLLAGILVWILL